MAEAIVTEGIDPKTKKGRVSTGGSSWIGASFKNTTIDKNTLIEIVAVSGATLIVKRKEL